MFILLEWERSSTVQYVILGVIVALYGNDYLGLSTQFWKLNLWLRQPLHCSHKLLPFTSPCIDPVLCCTIVVVFCFLVLFCYFFHARVCLASLCQYWKGKTDRKPVAEVHWILKCNLSQLIINLIMIATHQEINSELYSCCKDSTY